MDDPYARDKIEVEVSNLTKTVSAQKSIQIEARDFKLLFYENNPLEGIRFQTALSNLFLKQENIELKAESYFFAAEDKNELSFEWTINRGKVAILLENFIGRRLCAHLIFRRFGYGPGNQNLHSASAPARDGTNNAGWNNSAGLPFGAF
ncbi:MAG: hypothetical protein UV22_C0011G0014 [Parcubacteria group bacterium GW2011_GWA2_42_35]|nr:MAG: hypothetical protein UV22_C0011G0014 [Parcubacteria group bacterium GW2011_GWA2_42_35]